MHTIILFYNYVRIGDPEKLMREQRVLCEKLGLKGRVIVAHEGVNVTLEGKTEAIEAYCAALLADPRFADTHIKKSAGTGKAFPKLSVKVRKEIVSLGLPAEKDIDLRVATGKHMSADEFHSLLRKKEKGEEDFFIVDMRNDYEHASGYFKGSILPPIQHFRDLPKVLPTLGHLKDKKIVTVCTGGVRCEKASGLLVKNGFKNVYQLHGGIVTYMEKYENAASVATSSASAPAGNFLGSLYVFDDRVTMAFADAKSGQRSIVGSCELCGIPSEKYINCADGDCHRHFIVCEKCGTENLLCAQCRSLS